jgi:hypothetical protein
LPVCDVLAFPLACGAYFARSRVRALASDKPISTDLVVSFSMNANCFRSTAVRPTTAAQRSNPFLRNVSSSASGTSNRPGRLQVRCSHLARSGVLPLDKRQHHREAAALALGEAVARMEGGRHRHRPPSTRGQCRSGLGLVRLLHASRTRLHALYWLHLRSRALRAAAFCACNRTDG